MGVERIMNKMLKVAAVVAVVVSLMVGQSVLMAAPVHGAGRTIDRSAHLSIYQHFLTVLSAIRAASSASGRFSPSSRCAVWGGGC